MPYYLFKHPKKKKYAEVFQNMNDPHVYVDEFNVEWERIFLSPNTSIDTKSDPFSEKDFVKTTNKKGTLGDLMDQSEDFSRRRRDKDGIDTVREKYYDNWSKKRKGRTHPDKMKQASEISETNIKKILKKHLGN